MGDTELNVTCNKQETLYEVMSKIEESLKSHSEYINENRKLLDSFRFPVAVLDNDNFLKLIDLANATKEGGTWKNFDGYDNDTVCIDDLDISGSFSEYVFYINSYDLRVLTFAKFDMAKEVIKGMNITGNEAGAYKLQFTQEEVDVLYTLVSHVVCDKVIYSLLNKLETVTSNDPNVRVESHSIGYNFKMENSVISEVEIVINKL